VNNLNQYFTPIWAAEAIVERHFSNLNMSDLVIEPSCGHGAFLKALPSYVPAIGVEIDPAVAAVAAAETGRQIILGDFRTVELDVKPTLIIGNPPFPTKVIEGFFDRAYDLLQEGGQIAFILPSYHMQIAGDKTRGYMNRWSIFSEQIPRNIFEGLSHPLTFTIFTKDNHRKVVGFALYLETADLNRLQNKYYAAINNTQGSLWEAVCRVALEALGGRANLQDIYTEIEGNRPTETKFWRQKIRQTLRVYNRTFAAHGDGRYSIRMAA
jgi:hypothetical protein